MTEKTRESRPARKPYPIGTKVEIRNQFDRTWSAGFSIQSLTGNGNYHVARDSDGAVLPTEFGPADVRRVRKNKNWWI